MAYSRLLTSRNITLFSLATLASGFFMMKARTRSLAEHKKATGDYSVTVDRSGGGI